MQKKQLSKVLQRAQDICAQSGGKLTAKRQRILEILLQSATPLSAYEIADVYGKGFDSSIPVMSVYRMLDFLESEVLVHKLSSSNKFVACSHIACNHKHEVPQFLICQKCKAVKEIAIPMTVFQDLEEQVSAAQYQLLNSQLELQCLCQQCAGQAA